MRYLIILIFICGSLFAQDSTKDSTIYKFCVEGIKEADKNLKEIDKEMKELEKLRERWTGIYLEYQNKAIQEKKKLDKEKE